VRLHGRFLIFTQALSRKYGRVRDLSPPNAGSHRDSPAWWVAKPVEATAGGPGLENSWKSPRRIWPDLRDGMWMFDSSRSVTSSDNGVRLAIERNLNDKVFCPWQLVVGHRTFCSGQSLPPRRVPFPLQGSTAANLNVTEAVSNGVDWRPPARYRKPWRPDQRPAQTTNSPMWASEISTVPSRDRGAQRSSMSLKHLAKVRSPELLSNRPIRPQLLRTMEPQQCPSPALFKKL